MRIVIGEDQALMRAGLSLVLEQAGFEIVAIAADAEDVIRKTGAHRPDLLVTDIRMPPTNTDDGLRAAIEARTRLPGCRCWSSPSTCNATTRWNCSRAATKGSATC